jgi:creatinine amidohydrolase
VALIATGHTEQHAFHLPLATDTLIIDAIARGVEVKMPDTIFRLPTFPYGVSMHRRQYPGTVTIDPRAWEDFWVEIVGLLRERGLRMAYLINGHGGNHSFLVNVTKFCGDRWPDMFVATSFLHEVNWRVSLRHQRHDHRRLERAFAPAPDLCTWIAVGE